ncbi:uncharacterized protein OCT59_027003 [Rhizophagus irregularis]|uniref:uncharacterized protein n=1 Tax=Rhizophagus irregularis TaxID=588596 RepID=UPI00331AA0D7|nr:hypothetical protein OCT59_027003 [Rhizophagus irregularis]
MDKIKHVFEQIKDFIRYRLTKEQKSLVDKDKLSDDVFEQIKEFDHHFLTKEQELLKSNSLVYHSGYIVRCFGITKDPKTNDFIMVMDLKKDSLRQHLNDNFISMKKLLTLHSIAYGLNDIHNKGLIHQDFHSPEVLRGKKYIQACDIYGFGIIAYETCTGLPPYHNISKFVGVEVKVQL